MNQSNILFSMRFYIYHAWFTFKESWTNITSGAFGYLMYPFFMFVLGHIWQKFNSHQGNLSFHESIAYFGVTELFFMTFLSYVGVSNAASDFSLSLAKPRPWLLVQASYFVGRALGARLIYTLILAVVLLGFGIDSYTISSLVPRIFIFLIPLGILQALYALFFASATVRWESTKYLMMPFSKIFLVLGGVFSPLCDYSDRVKPWVLASPASDLFFQPAYFIVKGHFYQQSNFDWMIRVTLQIVLLVLFNILFFNYARRHHMSIGG